MHALNYISIVIFAGCCLRPDTFICNGSIITVTIGRNDSDTCKPEIVYAVDSVYVTAGPNVKVGCNLTLVPREPGADGFIITTNELFAPGEHLRIVNFNGSNQLSPLHLFRKKLSPRSATSIKLCSDTWWLGSKAKPEFDFLVAGIKKWTSLRIRAAKVNAVDDKSTNTVTGGDIGTNTNFSNYRITLNSDFSQCLVMGSPIVLSYFQTGPVVTSQFAVIVTEHVCFNSSGILHTTCELRSCIHFIPLWCPYGAINSELRCDGFSNCPHREDEDICLFRALSTFALIGTLLLVLIVISCALAFISYKRLSRRRTARAIFQDSAGTTSAQTIINLPPAYRDVIEPTTTSRAYGHSDIICMEDLPKYDSLVGQVSTSQEHATEPPATTDQELFDLTPA